MTKAMSNGFAVALAVWATAVVPCAAAGDVPRFTDVSDRAGIRFRYSFGDPDMSNIVEGTGSGCTWFDYDGDGKIDLYLPNGAYTVGVSDMPPGGAKPPVYHNRLYRNRGDGTFEDVTAKAGVGDTRFSVQAVAGDYDNDGDQDLFVTNYGRNTLYRNRGDGTFEDVTEKVGLGDRRYGMGATWVDVDRDGDLDLYVGNYLEFDKSYRLYYEADVFPGPLSYPGVPDLLYMNDGDGTFTEVSSRVKGLSDVKGRAMGILAADFDGDGRTDIFVANDAMENFLYMNRTPKGARAWVFQETALVAGVAYSASGDVSASMGGDVGDIDRDGMLDFVVPDMAFNNVYVNKGGGIFEDETVAVGVAEISGQFWSWGVDLFDMDNDGDLDVTISNGHGHRITETQENLLLEQVRDEKGRLRFRDVGPKSGDVWLRKMIGRGLCTADYDDDGDVDLFIVALDQPSVLLRNDLSGHDHWIEVALRGTVGNRDGFGARVTVEAGGLVQVQEKVAASSFVSQNDPRLHFGLGGHRKVDWIEVRWPSGKVQKVRPKGVDRVVEIVEASR